MLQRLAVTNPKNDKMDPHGVNPTLSIFLPTPFPVDMQGMGATAPWEKDLRIPWKGYIHYYHNVVAFKIEIYDDNDDDDDDDDEVWIDIICDKAMCISWVIYQNAIYFHKNFDF